MRQWPILEWIKAFSIKELCKVEWVCFRTIKKRTNEYIPINFESWHTTYYNKIWIQKTPYSTRYIRVKDLLKYMEKDENKKAREQSIDWHL